MTKRKARQILGNQPRLRTLGHRYFRPSFRQKRKWARFLFRKRAAISTQKHQEMKAIEATAWDNPNSMRLHADPYQRPQGYEGIVIDPFREDVEPVAMYRQRPDGVVEAIPFTGYPEMEKFQAQQADAFRRMDEVLRQPIDHQVSEFLRKADEEIEKHMIWGSPGEQSNLGDIEQTFTEPQDTTVDSPDNE